MPGYRRRDGVGERRQGIAPKRVAYSGAVEQDRLRPYMAMSVTPRKFASSTPPTDKQPSATRRTHAACDQQPGTPFRRTGAGRLCAGQIEYGGVAVRRGRDLDEGTRGVRHVDELHR